MSAIERCPKIEILVSSKNSFALTHNKNEKNHSLCIEEPTNFGHSTSKEAQDLVRTVMLSHLISPYLPKIIETNFPVESSQFLNELYEFYGFQPPKIIRSKNQERIRYQEDIDQPKDKIKFANAHSGGLDSVYRAVSLLGQNETPLAIHLRNLNNNGNFAEMQASRNQAIQWHLPYEEVRLKNSSGNTGIDAMRTRDLFLALIAAITAKPYSAEKILVEGGMSSVKEGTHFSEYEGAWVMFNNLLKEVGLDTAVEGVDPGDIETIGEVIKLEKELNLNILPLIQNCFSAPFQLPNNRRKWQRETPIIAENSPGHWCGSCRKCRRMTLGRIYYQDPRFLEVPKREVEYFINDTYSWIKNYPENNDLLNDSFLNHLETLKRKTG